MKQHQLRDMLFNKPYLVSGKEEKFTLWPRRSDRAVWPDAIEDAIPEYATADHLYLQAHEFFTVSAREYAAGAGTIRPKRMDALADALSTLFKLVVIDREDNDDAQVIFEVLNGRQTPLSVLTGAGSRVCGVPHSQRNKALPCRSLVRLHGNQTAVSTRHGGAGRCEIDGDDAGCCLRTL